MNTNPDIWVWLPINGRPPHAASTHVHFSVTPPVNPPLGELFGRWVKYAGSPEQESIEFRLDRFDRKIRRSYAPEKELSVEDVLRMVPAGWNRVVRCLINDLFNAGWDGHLAQAKEKFGTLRFYLGKTNDKLEDLIHQAEGITAHICASCGCHLTDANRSRLETDWILYECKTCRPGDNHEA